MLPNESSKIFVTYRNVSKVWFRIVPVKADAYRNSRNGDQSWLKDLFGSQPLQSWSADLPATEDYNVHSTEVKIPALPVGMYAVIMSSDEGFGRSNNSLSYAIFQSSALSVVMQNQGKGFVLHRKTGAPISGASVELYEQKYNSTKRRYEIAEAMTVKSGSDGSFNVPASDSRNYQAVSVKQGSDACFLEAYLNFYRYQPDNQAQEHTYFFTDRSIYRPGQTIYYKGIMVRSENRNLKNNIMPNEKTEVTFYDVNGQKITAANLVTNEFGSFTGSFTAPEGLLTGNMHIGNNTGSTYVSIEEYKRPKFSVKFDTLKNDYALNENIALQGVAQAYAGNNIDGANVSYRVVRRAHWPYWWYYSRWSMPTSPEMVVATGNAQTDKEGKFRVSFKAIPDETVDPRSMPVFTYTVYADVTDLNGETRSGSQSVSAGYVSLKVEAVVPEKARPVDLTTLRIRTENLNGRFVAAGLNVRISLLQQPSQVLRKRLWETPDQFVMDSISFKIDFPIDEYRTEADHTTWEKQKTVYDQKITTDENGTVKIPAGTWSTNGWYVIELEAKDKNGKQVIEKKFVHVWDKNNNGKVPAALVVVPAQQTVKPGGKAEVNAVSGYDNAVMIQQEQNMSLDVTYNIINYKGTPLTWQRSITEADRGGASVGYLMVKENRVYEEQATVLVPWANKDLDITWETHRDKLLPGEKEIWTMTVRGAKKEKVAAEMVATLYDASLDAFRPHKWDKFSLFPGITRHVSWNIGIGFSAVYGTQVAYYTQEGLPGYEKEYDRLKVPAIEYMSRGRMVHAESASASGKTLYIVDGIQTRSAPPGKAASFDREESKVSNQALEQGEATKPEPQAKEPDNISIRKKLQETAFFYPQLKTDADGNIKIQFTIPEALTEWKLMAYAHTKDMSTGILEGSVKTQKELMVMPNLPRFFRQGDDMTITAKVSNLGEVAINGTATIHILDAQTLQPLNLPFRLQKTDVSFSADKGQSAAVSWNVHVPESLYEPVIVRITASAGKFTDGEENAVPVLTSRMLVTETLPMPVNGSTTKEFKFDKLLHADTSKTLSHYNLTLEYTANPAWYAVQALPYLMEYPYECAEQTFNRYYATALAAHIVAKAPRVKEIFKSWQTIDTAALLSNLEKNQELKSALLEETPWVFEAKNESEQKRRIAMLFESTKLSRSLDANMKKLSEMQLPNGSFSWFKGMYPDRYITQYIATGLARLKHLGIEDGNDKIQTIINRALPYLDEEIADDYKNLLKSKAKLDAQNIGYIQVQYLYMRSFFPNAKAKDKTATDYYKKQAAKYWPSFNPYMKGMIAIAQHRDNNKTVSATIIQSLKETAIRKEEMGMYWMQRGQSYWWYDAPIEAQSLLIECFTEITKDVASIDAMKTWLLKQKQTQNWHTTKATADACYALLLQGTDWLSNDPVVTIQMGDIPIRSTEVKQEKGTGYFKTAFKGEEIKPAMGNIKVSVTGNDHSTSWGAVYWQYFENLDKISSAATPLQVKKQLFITRNTDRGETLEAITEKNVLKIGDKVTARIEIIVDRDMDYVHLKDMRAACFEPVNVISNYKWQGGLGYYESTKDASTNFFFGNLRKGKYVFEYPVFVTASGDFSNGIATIQCMYAPEFSSHSEGIRVRVQ